MSEEYQEIEEIIYSDEQVRNQIQEIKELNILVNELKIENADLKVILEKREEQLGYAQKLALECLEGDNERISAFNSLRIEHINLKTKFDDLNENLVTQKEKNKSIYAKIKGLFNHK